VNSLFRLRELIAIHSSVTSPHRYNFSFVYANGTAMLPIELAETQKLRFGW